MKEGGNGAAACFESEGSLIICFSGTGNTLRAAKLIAARLGDCAVVPMPVAMRAAEDKEKSAVFRAKRIIIMFPAYGYGPPAMALRFCRKARLEAEYFAAVVTYASSYGGSLAAVARILKRRGLELDYAGSVRSVENYIPIFGAPDADKVPEILAAGDEEALGAAAEIAEGQTRRAARFKPFSAVVSALFRLGRRVFVKFYRVSEDCSGCGLCQTVCPADCITIADGKPRFGSACEHCQACLNWCPRKAIGFGRMKPGGVRYRHPEIRPEEFKEIIVN